MVGLAVGLLNTMAVSTWVRTVRQAIESSVVEPFVAIKARLEPTVLQLIVTLVAV